ncbi:hypothetical protein PIB30_076399, partial [Stylosanthes scabra]|nr:hypothetical protein [Stylosanthes scabra]
ACFIELAGNGILTMIIESTKGTFMPPVLAEGTWLKPTTFHSGEPYLGLILSNRRVREVNRRMSSWPAFRTRKLRSWELIPPSEGWMCDADDEKEIGGMDPSEKEGSSEEDPEMEKEYPEEAGNPEDRVPTTPMMRVHLGLFLASISLNYCDNLDAEEDFQRYVEELGRALEPSPLGSSQAFVPDEPVEAADRQSASRDGSSYNLSGVWQSQSSSPSS